ncbi:hypothetical protein D3C81_08970 [compost metagenome]
MHVSKFKKSYITTELSSSSFNITQLDRLFDYLGKYGGLELDPEFQRGKVWTDEQCTKYIEGILEEKMMNKDLYFNWDFEEDGINHPTYCVDGLQRLTAAIKFNNGEIKPFGYSIHDLEGLKSMRYSFNVYVNKLKTYENVVSWYLSLNDTGIAHTKEDLDKAREVLLKELKRKVVALESKEDNIK